MKCFKDKNRKNGAIVKLNNDECKIFFNSSFESDEHNDMIKNIDTVAKAYMKRNGLNHCEVYSSKAFYNIKCRVIVYESETDTTSK